MKKIFLKVVSPLFIIGAAILVIGTGCPSGTTPVPVVSPCDSTATKFMALYNAHAPANNYSIDLQVHQYAFKNSVAGSICAVGYQGHPNLAGINAYKVEIIDSISGTVLNTGVYAFPSSNRGYKTFVSPVPIAANTVYIVRRTVINNLGNSVNTITNYKNVGPVLFITNGTLSVTSTRAYDFYSGTATAVNVNSYLPCIDIVLN